jgi:Uncharacterised protein family (UPF0236)
MESFPKQTHNHKETLMDFITYLQHTLTQQLPELLQGYGGDFAASSLAEMEKAVKQLTHEFGNQILSQWLEAQESKYAADTPACPHCGGLASYVRRRDGVSITLQGRVAYRRAYYLCASCQQGFYPLDEVLGIEAGQMSNAVVQLAAAFGMADAFGSSSVLLQRATLLELSPNSIRKATQVVGAKVLSHEQALIEQSQQLENQTKQAHLQDSPQRLYGSMDGFKVLFEDGWHDMKAGVWWTTKTDKNGAIKAENLRYYTDFLPASDFANLVWATGFDQKADQAQELIFVADGAEWIWNIVEQHDPQAVQIVDWYHACAYLRPIANMVFSNPQDQKAWVEAVKSDLWAGNLDAVIRACQQQSKPQHADDPAQKAVTYYQNNRQRMDYARYRELGYQIGSGSMESGCKQLGLERLKIAGARWSSDGARLVAKARAAYLSGDWDKLNSSADTLPQVA